MLFRSYEVARTRRLSLRDSGGKPVDGLHLSGEGVQKKQLFQGITDREGKVSVAVPVLVVSNDKGKPVVSENSAVELNFDKGACPAQTLRVAAAASVESEQTILCK